MTAAMLLLVYTLVEASSAGWGSARTLISFVVSALMIAAFVAWEQRTRLPLIRLGIFRSGPLVRANLAAMALFGSWVGFQFILTLYLQQARGWSSLETGVAIFPAGLIVAILASRIAPVVARFGVKRLIVDRADADLDRLRAVPADRHGLGVRHGHAARRSSSRASASASRSAR